MFGKEEPAAMMVIDFKHEGRPLARCLFAAGRLPEVGFSYQGDIARKTQPPHPDGGLRLRVRAPKWAIKRVCTMCTPWASDPVVCGPDCGGLRGEWRKFKGWNPVRVPPRARVFPVQGLRASECAQPVHLWAPSGAFFVSRCCGRAAPSLTGEAVLLLTHPWAGTLGTA
jgi:hypothetical protein